ncbi:hypothetical protein C8Q78DRAFT_1009545 [Trametes maxima]|nr:hypothetical protein C8Q78DRAFT_1009545 [Trametes maxima]
MRYMYSDTNISRNKLPWDSEPWRCARTTHIVGVTRAPRPTAAAPASTASKQSELQQNTNMKQIKLDHREHPQQRIPASVPACNCLQHRCGGGRNSSTPSTCSVCHGTIVHSCLSILDVVCPTTAPFAGGRRGRDAVLRCHLDVRRCSQSYPAVGRGLLLAALVLVLARGVVLGRWVRWRVLLLCRRRDRRFRRNSFSRLYNQLRVDNNTGRSLLCGLAGGLGLFELLEFRGLLLLLQQFFPTLFALKVKEDVIRRGSWTGARR